MNQNLLHPILKNPNLFYIVSIIKYINITLKNFKYYEQPLVIPAPPLHNIFP